MYDICIYHVYACIAYIYVYIKFYIHVYFCAYYVYMYI